MTNSITEQAEDPVSLVDEGHLLHEPKLTITRRFYCLGFPIDLATNSKKVEQAAVESWGDQQAHFERPPIQLNVTEIESGGTACPPAPVFRPMGHMTILVADANNFSICDMERGIAQVCVSAAATAHRSYLRYFFLEAAVFSQISTRYTAPVHAACVAFHNRGLLLCGDSGAGKSSLAYACARAGWTFTSDDASYLLLGTTQLCVTGNCRQLRFRPNARKLFPELAHYEITPRAAGKPSIEVPVSHFPSLRVSPTACINLIIFLNRLRTGPPALRPTSIDRAKLFMGQNYFGPPSLCALRNEATERVARAVPVLELSYSTLEDAVLHLEQYMGSAR